ncbi:UPF0481 protein At3g47200 [Ricinus communis]|uniref:UPF0481 protein At3g47200 n=1 Tax=Ricinus communis TaxID=3988 RepID=UPI00201A802E|nr:UPF0481 protein At3g47200 [Ricinus communis]
MSGSEPTANGESQREPSYSNLVSTIEETLADLDPPLSAECCIYKVPEKLRKVNEAAYTPQFVSIGPLHHGEKCLKKMEVQKLRYLKCFLQEAGSAIRLEELVSYIEKTEPRIRQCYTESFDYLSTDQFVKIVLVDAIFIIEFFLRIHIGKLVAEDYDFILEKPWMRNDIEQDLILLENQLPFFVLKDIYDLAVKSRSVIFPSFFELTLHHFRGYNSLNKTFPQDVKHFTDLLRYFQLPRSPKCSPIVNCFYNIVKVLRKIVMPMHFINLLLGSESRQKPERGTEKYKVRCATELHEAGVNFKVSMRRCLLDIKFTNLELEIPCINLYESTESCIRNLMALEQCHYPLEAKISDYIILLGYLINTAKDVELLVQKKILVNWLGDHHAAATLFNKLGSQILQVKENHYANIFKQQNAYCELQSNVFALTDNSKINVRNRHIKTPWRGASIVAPIILVALLVLTVL